ncbi:MAG: nucleotidyltransferase domain-containing protein [Candidatus Omnitrophica bacterium]|nr:nucleotidyltransferase domain-containing protein [Candidatus Omnitrophota bacterium]
MGMTLADKLNTLVEDLKRYDPEKIILFGSAATGTMDAYSDIDLVLVKKTDRPFVKRLRDVALLSRLDEAVDILVYTPEEMEQMKINKNFFMENVLKEGKILYERKAA